MAPIDPNQLLAAFAPLLTPLGGIKNATEVPRLSSLMKKFSRKLVSRCVYCNVLLATTPDVLEEFLRSGGWETIHLWIKSAKDTGNRPFLDELLKLLLKLPMNVDRLRENESPKMIRKLAKQMDDPLLAAKAQEVVDKWTKMIELNAMSGVKEKKRKSNDTNNGGKDSGDAKKSKLNAASANHTAESDSNASMDSSNSDLKATPERTPRPSTAKVKPGKSRLGDLVSQSSAKPVKQRKEDKKSIASNKPLNNAYNSDSLNSVTSTSVPKPKIQPIGGIKVIEPLPVTTAAAPAPTPVPPPVVVPPAKPHVLHDSTSFMDALIAPPTVTTKKKRRTSSSTTKETTGSSITDTTTASASTSSPRTSPPKAFSFYTDLIDEKVNDSNHTSEDNESMDAMDDDVMQVNDQSSDLDEELNHMNVDVTVPDMKVSPKVPSLGLGTDSPISVILNNKIKPILCYIKKGNKKSVRWIDENGRNNIEMVKFFELDETERVNVTRPPGAGGFGDLKRFDMRHEAEFMLMARRSANTMDVSDDYLSRAESRGAWRLIPCDGDSNLIEFGKDSKERLIQEDRMRTTLETFYTRNQIPDTPQEPDLEVYLETDISKVIPLEDDNNPNNIHDFSNIDLPQPKTGEQLPSRIPDFIAGQPPINNFGRMPSPQYTGGGPPMGGPNFAGQSMIPPFSAQPLLPPPDQFGVRMPSGPPPQQYFAPNNGPPFQQWGDGGSGPGPGGPPMPHGPQFAPPFPGGRGMGGRPPRLPRNAQNTVCRHYARTGKCRFQPKCNFLHSNESNR